MPDAVPPRGFFAHLVSVWAWKMAWRDSRMNRRKLALFSSSVVAGIALLAAIGSLNRNLSQAIEEQSKALLGADLVIHSRDAFTPEENQWMKSLGGEESREISMSSMVLFPRTGNTRLAQVRALSGGFPFYGSMETKPAGAVREFRLGRGALVEETLLQQFGAHVGDEIQIGKLTTHVVGRLEKVPGETAALSTIAPRVYIRLDELPRTDLLQDASLAQFRAYFKFGPQVDVPALVRRIRPELEKFRLHTDTVEERKRDLGRATENLDHFLNLAGFIALLLGCVGVASAVHVHVKQKIGTAAVLRCLGGTVGQTFAVYLSQGIGLGLFGALLGGALGMAIQAVLPGVLGDFIPFTIPFHPAWLAVGRAMLIGLVVCLLFTLLPLLTVRRVSPLAALRASFEPVARRRDPWRWAIGACLAAGILGFALMQTRNWRMGLGFALGLACVFGVLAGVAKLLIIFTRRFVPARLPFTIRQGIANLHRPHNRTLLLLLSLGLGTFLMTSLYLIQNSLLRQLITTTGPNQPNAVLFDIQNAQVKPVLRIVKSLNVPVLDQTPIVSMRLASVNGRSIEEILSSTNRARGRRHWAYRHEFRSTYRDELRDGETLVAGHWVGRVTNDASVVPISLEQGIAQDLHVGVGDGLVFNVQSVPVTTRVASLRKVEWRRIQPNFFVVFPDGVLEDAPAMHVLVMHVRSSEQSAALQREVVKAFPNVSAIDLTLVLQTVDAILGKIAFVIRFLAMFTVVTGFLVLLTALWTGRYQRIQQSVLLRTLGASRGQIITILLVEYFALGVLAAMTGILLALPAVWMLARNLFHVGFAPSVGLLAVAMLIVPCVTVITGFLMSRGVMNHPPLAILRKEG